MWSPEPGSEETAGRTVIVEPRSSGHRLYYVRLLAEGCHDDVPVWLTSRQAAESRAAEIHLGRLVDEGTLAVVIGSTSRRKVLGGLIGPASRGAASHVIIPDGDSWLLLLIAALGSRRTLRSRTSVRLLMLRPPRLVAGSPSTGRTLLTSLTKGRLIRLLSLLSGRLACDWQVLGLGDPFGILASFGPGFHSVPDPVAGRTLPARSDARARFDIDLARPVVAVLGGIDRRKNPGLVANAVASMSPETTLLLVGTTTTDASTAVRQSALSRDRRVEVDRYVSEDEMSAAARCADVIAIMYDNHQSSSGILALAAQAGAPVVVPRGSRLEEVVTALGTGYGADFDTQQVADQLTSAIAERARFSTAIRAASARLGVDEFVAALTRDPRTQGQVP